MAQMWEALRNGGSTVEGTQLFTGKAPDRVLPEAHVLHADLPWFYFSEGLSEHTDLSDFWNLTPRFRSCFVERRFTWRTFGAVDEPLPSWQDPLWRRGLWIPGLLFEAVDLRGGRITGLRRRTLLRYRMRGVAGQGIYNKAVRWCLIAYLYCADPKLYVPEGPLVLWLLPIREDGSVQPNRKSEAPSLTRIPLGDEYKTGPAQSAYADAAMIYLLPALFVISALNSPLTRLVPDRNGAPGPRGKTFTVDTTRLQDILSNTGKAEEEGLVRAMLTCRQHFYG